MPRFAPGRAERTEFVRWLAGMPHRASPRLIALYRRALICQQFPAYRFEDLRAAPAELLTALELLALARQVQAAPRG